MGMKGEPPLTEAQRRLVEEHMTIVETPAARLASAMIPVEDRRQDGYIGLIDAAARFDPTSNASFRTYAYKRVRGAMLDAERRGEGASIRQSRDLWVGMCDEEKWRSQPVVRLGREKWAKSNEVEDVFAYLVDVPEPAEDAPYDEDMLRLAVDRLGGKAAKTLRAYYWGGLTMREIGRRLGVTESAISLIHADAIRRLRVSERVQQALAG